MTLFEAFPGKRVGGARGSCSKIRMLDNTPFTIIVAFSVADHSMVWFNLR